MNRRIYISCNTLPNTNNSLAYLYKKIANSNLKDCPVTLVHDNNFNFYNLNKYNLKISYILGEDNSFEYPCLYRLWVDSLNDNFFGLYLHCKGSSKTENLDIENSYAWMYYMLLGLVDNTDLCLYYLNKGADLVGSMWYRHFKGNFFWFKSEYIKKLINPMSLIDSGRFAAEYWCGSHYWFNSNIPIPLVKNLFYLPLVNDLSFIELKNKNYMPDLTERYVCNDIDEVIANNYYGIFDEIKNIESISDRYTPYLNFNP
jgi:hypothetical protein